MKKLMIYGAAGYTGSMVAEHARAAGLSLVLAGRDQSRAELEAKAARLGAETRIFEVNNAEAVGTALKDVAVLLNAAGPFASTAEPLMVSAIHCGVHYLDFSAELDTYRRALALDAQARAVGVMLLPGSGGSVAMLGSLAGHVVARAVAPRRINVALHVAGGMSKGSAISAQQNVVSQTLRLVDGQLVSGSPEDVRDFDFGLGLKSSFPVTLPDLLTIHHATGVADIGTFVHVSSNAFPRGDVSNLAAGPSAKERDENRYQAAIEVTDADGTVLRALLDTVNGYTFTAMAAAEAARRVLNGEVKPGFQTPAGLFGHSFAASIADTRITDLESSPA